MRRLGQFLLVRLVWVLGLLSLAAWCGGCRCGSQSYDQVFLLNASVDGSLIQTDAGDASDAGAGTSLDCTPTARDCLAGGSCQAACRCAIGRDLPQVYMPNITKCTLLVGAVPAVEAHYTITFSGCGD